MSTEAIRKSVPLSPDELDALNAARTEGTTEHDALTELAGPAATRSEATTLAALLALGFTVVRDKANENGYAALAAEQDDEDRAYEAAMRKRVRDREH